MGVDPTAKVGDDGRRAGLAEDETRLRVEVGSRGLGFDGVQRGPEREGLARHLSEVDLPAKLPPRRQLWYRASSRLPDDPAVHRYLLAYASDFNFLPTAMMPHRVSWVTPGMQVASLDHAMWFHRPFRFDEWLLYDVQSPSASGGRGLVLGRFYTRDGLLVASVAQEGLMRNRSVSWAG